jgi:hypothetical protein
MEVDAARPPRQGRPKTCGCTVRCLLVCGGSSCRVPHARPRRGRPRRGRPRRDGRGRRALRGDRRARAGRDRRSHLHSTLLRPDVFRAVGLLGVPCTPPGGPRPSGVSARMAARTDGEADFYVSCFQQPGRVEAEIDPDVRDRLAGFCAALSAGILPRPGAPPRAASPGAGGCATDSRPDVCRPGPASTNLTSTPGSSNAPAWSEP